MPQLLFPTLTTLAIVRWPIHSQSIFLAVHVNLLQGLHTGVEALLLLLKLVLLVFTLL
jgi:hypothetical protein